MRIYSAIRSVEKGEVLAKLVSEVKINNQTSVTVIDDGYNQETISFE
jgi:myo-inositol-hexaphosphate 3-phosphohydrolase